MACLFCTLRNANCSIENFQRNAKTRHEKSIPLFELTVSIQTKAEFFPVNSDWMSNSCSRSLLYRSKNIGEWFSFLGLNIPRAAKLLGLTTTFSTFCR